MFVKGQSQSFTVRGVTMKKQQFIDMQEQGTSTIPNLLLTHYKQLGLNETELILLLKIKMHFNF